VRVPNSKIFIFRTVEELLIYRERISMREYELAKARRIK